MLASCLYSNSNIIQITLAICYSPVFFYLTYETFRFLYVNSFERKNYRARRFSVAFAIPLSYFSLGMYLFQIHKLHNDQKCNSSGGLVKINVSDSSESAGNRQWFTQAVLHFSRNNTSEPVPLTL